MPTHKTFALKFETPAFMGGADQSACWRTPPIKALLRQWWRIRYAADVGFKVGKLRRREGELFGQVFDQPARQSRIRLRINDWGRVASKGAALADEHYGQNFMYAGYGKIALNKQKKPSAEFGAIQATRKSELTLMDWGRGSSALDQLDDVLLLMHWFGALGGRSRNGWGSLSLTPLDDGTSKSPPPFPELPLPSLLPDGVVRDYSTCLEHDWPHAVGADGKGALIWRTSSPSRNWKDALATLIRVKRELRSSLPLTGANPDHPKQRHLLGYPVSGGRGNQVRRWGTRQRLASQLPMKVCSTKEGFVGLIYHLPHDIPHSLAEATGMSKEARRKLQHEVWPAVHAELDTQDALTRLC